MSLTINQRTVGDITILDLSGKITIGAGNVQLRDAVRKLIENGNKKILLNLGDVSYVDSSGIGELVSSFTTTSNSGGSLNCRVSLYPFEPQRLRVHSHCETWPSR